MEKAKLSVLSIILFLLAALPGAARQIEVNTEADTSQALIGERIGLRLNVSYPQQTEIIWPSIGDTLGRLEIIRRSAVDTLRADSVVSLRQKFAVTSFDTGNIAVPNFTVMYEKPGITTLVPASSNTFALRFKTVEADTSGAIKDIKGPIDEPVTLMEILPYVFAVLALAGAAFAIFFYLKKRKSKEKQPEPEFDPEIPPHVFALEALRNLEKEKLWQNDQVKKYHIRLTEIIRIYIQRRFDIPALEMTTDEILERMSQAGISSDLNGKLRQLLTLGDLAKFAKFRPLPEENSLSMTNAYDFVESTKQETDQKKSNGEEK
jgi:hypothetical protein